jgi:GTP-binding protein
LKLLSVEFVTSAAAGGRTDDIPRDGLAHIAFAGRSNVGKSSLLNALCRKPIARTSAAPGKTRLANIYRVSAEGGAGGPGRWSCYLVDLPGYGYARGGADAANELAGVAKAYFGDPSRAGALDRCVLQLVDSRHPGLDSDVQAARWFDSLGVVRHIVATKVDKLTRAERAKNLGDIERVFGMAALPASAASGEGLDALWKLIANRTRVEKRR